jgi:hypothetical protein
MPLLQGGLTRSPAPTCGKADPRHAAAAAAATAAAAAARCSFSVPIAITPGLRAGTMITLSTGLGPGGVAVVVREALHAVYRRVGDDLCAIAAVPLVVALTGGRVLLRRLDGRPLEITLPEDAVAQHGARAAAGERAGAWQAASTASLRGHALGCCCGHSWPLGELRGTRDGARRAVLGPLHDPAAAHHRDLTSRGRTPEPTALAAAGQVISLQGEGMPRTSDPSRRGNLHVRLQIVFPASLAALSDAQRQALRRALDG